MNPFKTFFYSLKRSLLEPKYYQDVKEASFWFSYKYLLFLVFLLMIIKTFSLGIFYFKSRPYIKPQVDDAMNYAQTFYPNDLELKVTNGQLSTNVREPYIFDLKNNNSFQANNRHLLTIDTQGSIDNYPNYNTYILATRNAVVYPSKSNNNQVGETSVFFFSDLKQNFTLNRGRYDGLLNVVKPYTDKALFFVDSFALSFSPLFLIFGSLFWTNGIMLGLVFLTFFVWIINLIFKKGYKYGSLYKMGMHAVTWPILISEVLGYIRPSFPNFYSWIFLALMLVIIFKE